MLNPCLTAPLKVFHKMPTFRVLRQAHCAVDDNRERWIYMYSAKEAAEMTGLSTAALRYYEKEQLLPQISRTSQKYRQYSDSDIEWIKMVQCLRRANVPIQSVKKYIPFP